MTSRFSFALGAVGALLIGALALGLLGQDKQIERLDSELSALRAELREQRSAEQSAGSAPSAVSNTPAPSLAAPAVPRASAPQLPTSTREPRAVVSSDEIARVESAVLSLLESDHPELRAKLRAVVQEQQQTLEQEQREQRRERWVARREASLLELSKSAGLSDEQRQTLLTIMLASRDQIGEVMQNAETAESFNTARDKARALREAAEAQIREQLSAEQYEAYRARFEDDDDDERRRQGSRPRAPRDAPAPP